MNEETKMITKKYSSFDFKGWFTKNIKKIIFALALIGAVTGSIGLILGSVSVNRTNELTYYLKSDYTAVFGKGTIWVRNYGGFSLYFAKEKKSFADVKWNGEYPKGYFDDEK